ncbi:thioredoxin domain-containing protein [Cryptosporidium canis]|uniref:Thioredoxin domain-containing protein n=1 Tax=Cryptosporidium canis TaxID=195482 RepID=A0ABQ8P8A6_9CRYT|nr:thioredoxin domain-containing protein [Cryptosporidium canis]KAJ1613863.1 thioredoxin domain-containing protein [Cryptosporidium canis]
MIICLGPFCIPIWNIILFLLALINPVANIFKRFFLQKGSISECKNSPALCQYGKISEEKELGEMGIDPSSEKEMYERISKIVELNEIVELESTQEWEICKILGSKLKLPILIDYYAEWCVPCKKISPIFKRFSKEYEGIFIKINYDDHSNFCNALNIFSLPTFHCWVLKDNSYVLADKLERSDPKELENILHKNQFKAIK